METTTFDTESNLDELIKKHINMQALKVDIHALLDGIADKRVQELEDKLKRNEAVIDHYQGIIERMKEDHSREMKSLKILDHRVVCLIDGDGSIFSLSEIAKGQAGGLSVATRLTEAIRGHVPSEKHPYHLYAWIFYNRSGLLETLKKYSKENARKGFDDFVLGFNRASERFLMTDVGSGKEAVDSKLRAILEDQIKSVETIKVIFGGCHDNGYLNTLRSLITSGHADKLVLLRGYREMAAGFQALQVPSLEIQEMFEPEKLGTLQLPTMMVSPPLTPPGLTKNTAMDSPSPTSPQAVTVKVRAVSWSSIAQANMPIPWRKSSISIPKLRPVVPKKPLSKHEPPPCNMHYLARCKFGESCDYAHDYDLKPVHIEEMRSHAQRTPCSTVNRGEFCAYGDNCCFGHKCPFGTKCFYNKDGSCWFVGANMHED
ncbi:hypothetical protein C8Q75DRAFT_802236 [Abortiporus biennis]|nr:hypothetical protein C8Q75DRAFT_802236 [Abortiporus biennis]